MASMMTCRACRAPLQIGNLAAGQQVRCPRCQTLVTVPPEATTEGKVADDPPVLEAVSEEPLPAARKRPCPECGQSIALTARKCRYCKAWLDEEDDPVSVRYRPCPRCGDRGATRVIFTFWGSFYGPALFTHVRCPNCGYAYNGKTGRSNLVPAIFFVTIPAVLLLAIFGSLIYLIVRTLA